MKVVVAGGAGHVGRSLLRCWPGEDEIVVLSRSPQPLPRGRVVLWDGRTVDKLAQEIDGADVVVNLAGRTVNCRYYDYNLDDMMSSRIDSTRAIGEAISLANRPPEVWLQSSTATIYAHRYDAANDESTGVIGGQEDEVPLLWKRSVEIALAWEAELHRAETPRTRKVALRSAMVMGTVPGSVFSVLAELAARGLGGTQGDGRQFVSWVHEEDWVRALAFIIDRGMEGAINIASPNPLPQAEFARQLRKELGIGFAPRLPEWALEVGAYFKDTETELILKSRRVVPGRLIAEGFEFQYPTWAHAARELSSRLKQQKAPDIRPGQ